jgi:glycosyltransferase involved in cell wall biosynthesis
MTASAGKARLKVLFFAQRFPYPMDTGGKIRTGKLLEYLNNVFDITLISNVESPKDDRHLDQVGKLCSRFIGVPWKEERKYSLKFYWRTAVRSISRYPISVLNDYSPSLETTVLKTLTHSPHDLAVCDFLQPSLNFRKVTGCPTVLFQHNIESVILKRYAETAHNPLLKRFWRSQWGKMEQYELRTCRQFTGVITVSETDKAILDSLAPGSRTYAIPTGVDTRYFCPRNEPVKENSLVFTGSMDWLPNEDAILYFVERILPSIRTRIPNVTLTVVGRNPSSRLLRILQKHPTVQCIGAVDDVRPFIARHALYVIPLRIGGGTRIKAYEAMAMGKAVVSTRVGVEGLPLRDQEHVVLADTPKVFGDAVVALLRNPKRRRQIEKAARDFVEHHCSWEKAGKAFADICLDIASLSRSAWPKS